MSLVPAGLLALMVSACASTRPAAIPEQFATFIDTERPNALVTLPAFDEGGFPFSFDHPKARAFYTQLAQHYDTRFVITGSEQDVYRALDSTPDIALWILSGHGSGNSVRVGRGKNHLKRDAAFIDVSDSELAQHTANLRKDAVIYIDACASGHRLTPGYRNVATSVAESTCRAVVTSDTTIFWETMTVKPWYPFDIHIGGLPDEDGVPRDTTVRIKACNP